ncbi:MAG: FecR domain-containing protein [Magnetococcus sp. DMHC-6]
MGHSGLFTTICCSMITYFTITLTAYAGGIAQVKNIKGSAFIEREGRQAILKVGDVLEQADIIYTEADGAVGIVFMDNSLVSVGPETVLALDQFEFNTTTHEGVFNSSLRQGTLAVKSGKIVKHSPEAMKINTRHAVLAVRGTEFVVSADY